MVHLTQIEAHAPLGDSHTAAVMAGGPRGVTNEPQIQSFRDNLLQQGAVGAPIALPMTTRVDPGTAKPSARNVLPDPLPERNGSEAQAPSPIAAATNEGRLKRPETAEAMQQTSADSAGDPNLTRSTSLRAGETNSPQVAGTKASPAGETSQERELSPSPQRAITATSEAGTGVERSAKREGKLGLSQAVSFDPRQAGTSSPAGLAGQSFAESKPLEENGGRVPGDVLGNVPGNVQGTPGTQAAATLPGVSVRGSTLSTPPAATGNAPAAPKGDLQRSALEAKAAPAIAAQASAVQASGAQATGVQSTTAVAVERATTVAAQRPAEPAAMPRKAALSPTALTGLPAPQATGKAEAHAEPGETAKDHGDGKKLPAHSSGPTSSAPASIAPASTAPASTGPVSTVPVSTVPASTVPVSTVPVSTGPVFAPAATLNGAAGTVRLAPALTSASAAGRGAVSSATRGTSFAEPAAAIQSTMVREAFAPSDGHAARHPFTAALQASAAPEPKVPGAQGSTPAIRPAAEHPVTFETSAGGAASSPASNLSSLASPPVASMIPAVEAHALAASPKTTASNGMPMHEAATPNLSADAPGALSHTRTLVATPTLLEVALTGAEHGGLRVRAELAPTGEVTASLVPGSASAGEALHQQLGAMTDYLKSESLHVGSVAIAAPAAMLNFGSVSGAGASSFGALAGSGEGSQAGRKQDQQSEPSQADRASTDGLAAQALSPGAGSGAGAGSAAAAIEGGGALGGWLSVRV